MKRPLTAIAVMIAIGAIVTTPNPASAAKEKTPEEKEADRRVSVAVFGAKQLRGMMNDPASFSLETALVMDDGTVCYSYRARNGFNAVMPGQAVLAGDKIITSSDTSGRFARTWNARCAGKSGRDAARAARSFL